MGFYDYTVRMRDNSEKSLKDYQGKVVLVVNTATECGFTPTYKDLEALNEKYHAEGLEILDFPCNQFGGQAPGTDEEINNFCTLHYNTKFTRFHKIEVNGKNEDPLYTYLKSKQGFKGFDKGHKLTSVLEDILGKADPDWAKKSDIKWNFTKFLVDRHGKVVARFEPTTDHKKIAEAIEALL